MGSGDPAVAVVDTGRGDRACLTSLVSARDASGLGEPLVTRSPVAAAHEAPVRHPDDEGVLELVVVDVVPMLPGFAQCLQRLRVAPGACGPVSSVAKGVRPRA